MGNISLGDVVTRNTGEDRAFSQALQVRHMLRKTQPISRFHRQEIIEQTLYEIRKISGLLLQVSINGSVSYQQEESRVHVESTPDLDQVFILEGCLAFLKTVPAAIRHVTATCNLSLTQPAVLKHEMDHFEEVAC
ncbi:MAG: hypothetical protein CML16_00715 [Pusillimonas sp.]|nr:hypothetical protein [Pusillimonas sp.]